MAKRKQDPQNNDTRTLDAARTSTESVLVLAVVSGPGRGMVFPLEHAARIGRGEDVEVCIPDTSLSRHHARVLFGPTGTSVEDMGSKNGTKLNDKPLEGRMVFQVGDRLSLGETELALRTATPHEIDEAKVSSEYRSQLLALRPRELEVVYYLVEGMSLKEVALALGVSVKTVSTHTERAYQTLHVSNRAELVRVGTLGNVAHLLGK